MELLAIARILWCRRLLVALGAVAVIALAVMVATGPASTTAVATTRVALDTERSQLVDGDPPGADTLIWRGQMLADLVASRPVADRIAREAGIPADQLFVVDPELSIPTIAGAIPRHAVEVAAVETEPYVLTVGWNVNVPIIGVTASAPDRAHAKRLANAAVDSLERSDTEVGSRRIQGFVVESIAPVEVEVTVSGRKRAIAVMMAVVLLGLWCAAIVVGSSLLAGRRRRRATAYAA